MGMMIQSDCCGEPMSGSQIDHEICPRCGEHCKVLSDEYDEWQDYFPLLQDQNGR